ncbi:hypothetical protein [Pseudomonas costantinii]|uniref:hypothetical protein n=1 Tax=Pseudomonas costantinii TaxID=168469 RepID=UPI0015A0819E|nr:hypothetical protein [Pseudomonas costantinii]NVZ70376.1 hypothetical protein [Pseudomonas costantinii]
MRPPKNPLPGLTLSLCIAAGSLLAGNASAFSQATPLLSTKCGSGSYFVKTNAHDYYANALKRLGMAVMSGHREWPRLACSEKLAHLPVHRPLNQAAAPQPLALMPPPQHLLARGMTFKKLLGRRSVG